MQPKWNSVRDNIFVFQKHKQLHSIGAFRMEKFSFRFIEGFVLYFNMSSSI